MPHWQRIMYSVLLGAALLTVSIAQDDAYLTIMPFGAQQYKALEENLILTCVAQVDNPDLLQDLMWTGPDGNPIPRDSSEDFLGERKYTEAMSQDRNMLFIKNIQQEDAGTYRCSAKYAGTKDLSVNVTLDTFLDITWQDAPTEQHAIKDKPATIKCHVVANPSPTVDWLKDGVPFKPNERCKAETEGIVCEPITQLEEGQYVCRARVTTTGRIAERLIKVEVDVIPTIDNLQSEYNTIEEERLVMTCSATGKPIPVVKWINKEGDDLSLQNGYMVDERTGELVIEKVSREDHGTFTCIVENSAGEVSGQTRVKVVGKPKIKEFKNVTAEKGKESKIICRVFAEPAAQITLMKKDSQREFEVNQQYDDNIIVDIIQDGDDQVFTVTIKEVSDDDDGLYICTARNDGGLATAVGHVTVEFAPVFDKMPDIGRPIKSWSDNVVNLTCFARSIPNATIEWMALGETSMDVLRDPHIVKIGDGPVSTLQIKTVGNLYYREYRCKAINKVGENTFTMRVEQAFEPKQLQQASIQTLTATTASFIIVGPLDNGGMPITNYVVEYTEEGGEVRTRFWPAISEQGHTYLLEKLTPEKRYTFRFAAANAVGPGLFSHSQERVMPKKDVPEEPVIVIRNGDNSSNRFNSVYPDKAEIIWKLPADNGEGIKHFTINYYPVKDGVSTGDGNTIHEPYPGTQLFLKDLQPDTEYKVEVRAYNSIGFSSPGQVFVRTAHGTVSDQQQMEVATVAPEIIIGIVVAVFVILLIVIDVACYFVNKCGLLMCICVHICGKDDPSNKGKDAMMESGKDSEKDAVANNGKKEPCNGLNGDVTDKSKATGKGDGNKPAMENGDEGIKEPSEETPMITGDKEKEALKDAMDNDYRNKSPHGSKSSIAKDSPV